MSRKLKAVLLVMGVLATLLVISQLVMGLMIVQKGMTGSDITKLAKMHQHSGYLTVTVALLYIVTSLVSVLRLPVKSQP